jgi:DNA-binding helix-hairpin-helix protein with protein kinase domain
VQERAASNSRFPTQRRKPLYTTVKGRTLLLLGIVAFAALVVLGVQVRDEGASRTVSYRGELYERAAVATRAHVDEAEVAATGLQIEGQEVFAERRSPSRVLFLRRADGEFDAFVLVDE